MLALVVYAGRLDRGAPQLAWAVPPGAACDALSDKEEIQVGWRVQLRGAPEGKTVYPNPNQGDSDRDTLTDDEVVHPFGNT